MTLRLFLIWLTLAFSVAASAPAVAEGATEARFERWVAGYRGRALTAGIRPGVFDAAFRGVHYNAEVVERDRKQAEIVKPIWEYLARAVSDERVRDGRVALRQNRKLLDAIEAKYGVEAEVVAAIWGIESAYGTRRGDIPVIEALATLAYDGRRGRFFESQLTAALRILQNGDAKVSEFTGSWAGAMGHTQFIPTSWAAFAVDWDGDGRRDVWSDDPADALASAAAYLAKSGWRHGQPWGVEVTLPRGFDFALADRSIRRSPSDWARLGVRDTAGKVVPDHGRASIIVPAGGRGPAFMIFDNFSAIERYNRADAYVISVGHLSDRLAGGSPISADWPRGDRALTPVEIAELQRRLARAGFAPGGDDGKLGPRTRAAIRAWQRSVGEIPDGYASARLLAALR